MKIKKQQGHIGNMETDWADWLLGLFILATVAIVALAIYLGVQEHKRWEAFRVAHACKVVAEMDGDLITTIGAKGQVSVGSTSDKLGWLCDNGITYYKDK
jgi:Mg2+/citrate symporter